MHIDTFAWNSSFPWKWSPGLRMYNGIWIVFWARTRSCTTQKTYIILYISWYLTRWNFMASTKMLSLAFVLFWWFSSPGPTLAPFRGEAAQNLQKPIRLLILLEHNSWFLLKSSEKTYIFVVKFGDFWWGPISGSAQVSKNNNKYMGICVHSEFDIERMVFNTNFIFLRPLRQRFHPCYEPYRTYRDLWSSRPPEPPDRRSGS